MSDNMDLSSHDEQVALCKYGAGNCRQTCAIKDNGKPHRFCEYHRQQANRIQRQVRSKKRTHDGTSPMDFMLNFGQIPFNPYMQMGFPAAANTTPAVMGATNTSDVLPNKRVRSQTLTDALAEVIAALDTFPQAAADSFDPVVVSLLQSDQIKPIPLANGSVLEMDLIANNPASLAQQDFYGNSDFDLTNAGALLTV